MTCHVEAVLLPTYRHSTVHRVPFVYTPLNCTPILPHKMGNIVIIKMRLVSVVLLYIRSIILPVIRRQASFDSKRARAQCHDDAGGSSLYHKIPALILSFCDKTAGRVCSTIFACTHCQTLIIITRFATGGEMNVPSSKAPR